LASVPALDGKWTVHPVEYKRGQPKQIDCDRVQLCAQAMCLEEMLRVHIPEASLYYGQPRRRETVSLDDRLRNLTRQTAASVHALIRSGVTPPPGEPARCRGCSLADKCMPKRAGQSRSASLYLRRQLTETLQTDSPEADIHEEA
jgi:CRISPR-associated exonuclease Cas4